MPIRGSKSAECVKKSVRASEHCSMEAQTARFAKLPGTGMPGTGRRPALPGASKMPQKSGLPSSNRAFRTTYVERKFYGHDQDKTGPHAGSRKKIYRLQHHLAVDRPDRPGLYRISGHACPAVHPFRQPEIGRHDRGRDHCLCVRRRPGRLCKAGETGFISCDGGRQADPA